MTELLVNLACAVIAGAAVAGIALALQGMLP